MDNKVKRSKRVTDKRSSDSKSFSKESKEPKDGELKKSKAATPKEKSANDVTTPKVREDDAGEDKSAMTEFEETNAAKKPAIIPTIKKKSFMKDIEKARKSYSSENKDNTTTPQ